ncbi:MAG: gatY [Sphingomonas bacterium]|jgi:ketose-bisphosphate aldolase|nr:gatY [Sphingomonas bacterium]MDB5682358.1 gatY [Sphingomonas bacterium]MDB5718260.1 gatY [Sphingomonas bacterium]
MPLVSMKPVLREAMEQGYAVAAFNLLDFGTTKAMIRAAEELNAPVIIQASTKTIKYFSHKEVYSWVATLAEDSPVPVVLHLDHCKDLEVIRKCLDTGWTSVMVDASELPFEENLALSRQVVEMAAKKGVHVEAEIGQIMGVEDDMVVAEDESHLTDPAEAERFCKELDLAAFAAAIGSAHGYYKGVPKIAFDLIKEINGRTKTPMALHGGTGLDEATIAQCIANGCAKINISTNLKHVFIESFLDYNKAKPNDFEPLRYIDAQYQACKALFKSKIAEFGGTNRAAELLAKAA